MNSGSKSPTVYEQVYALVRKIPRGKVTSYGRIAREIEGCTARMVGYALAALPWESNVPWQRVINHQGKVSPRNSGHGSWAQRELLEAEGVAFDAHGRADFQKYGWRKLHRLK